MLPPGNAHCPAWSRSVSGLRVRSRAAARLQPEGDATPASCAPVPSSMSGTATAARRCALGSARSTSKVASRARMSAFSSSSRSALAVDKGAARRLEMHPALVVSRRGTPREIACVAILRQDREPFLRSRIDEDTHRHDVTAPRRIAYQETVALLHIVDERSFHFERLRRAARLARVLRLG